MSYEKTAKSIQNITTSAIENSVNNVATVNQGKELDWVITAPGNKKCKVVITCDAANTLITELRKGLKEPVTTFNQSINGLIKSISSDIATFAGSFNTETFEANPSFNLQKFENYINTTLKNYQKQYSDFKTKKANALKAPIKNISIPAQVFIKGLEGRHTARIYEINLGNKSVDIEYTYQNPKSGKNVTEKLIDINIKNLCIEQKDPNTPCTINFSESTKRNIEKLKKQVGGSRPYTDKDQDQDGGKPDYMYICE